MGDINRVSMVILTFILVTASLLLASAQSIPKPSTPEFTVKFVDRSYTVEESSHINQFTGELEVFPAHRVLNYTVELAIKNQQIAPAMVSGGNAEFRYDVNVKGRFAQNWTIMYLEFEGPKSSSSDYTLITYELVLSPTYPEQGVQLRGFDFRSNTITGIPPNSQLDFRVRAMYGAMHRSYNPNETLQILMFPWVFTGESSGWSSTQTITIPAFSTTSPTLPPDSTPSPYNTYPSTFLSDNTQLTIIAIVVAVLAVIIASLLLYIKALKKTVRKIVKNEIRSTIRLYKPHSLKSKPLSSVF
jgi:hypothetical protein